MRGFWRLEPGVTLPGRRWMPRTPVEFLIGEMPLDCEPCLMETSSICAQFSLPWKKACILTFFGIEASMRSLYLGVWCYALFDGGMILLSSSSLNFLMSQRPLVI